MFLPAVRVRGVDICAVFHEEMNHFVVTCADGVMKSCDAISVWFTWIVHLGRGERRRIELIKKSLSVV